jgi:hypothetical protein
MTPYSHETRRLGGEQLDDGIARDLGLSIRMRASQINDDVVNRLGAAREEIAFRRPVERLRFVHDLSGHETALAVVPDARTSAVLASGLVHPNAEGLQVTRGCVISNSALPI